jgi:hypothetical protein
MIYANVLVSTYNAESVVEANKFIDFLLGLFNDWTHWTPDKTAIKVKLNNDESYLLDDVKNYLVENVKYSRLEIFNEEEKTETIMDIRDGKIEGTYLLPLFPENYKF